MYINPRWRILTVGDGDLSFSFSLLKHHKPRKLTATIFDSYRVLSEKYGVNNYHQLSQNGCEVLTQFDVTNPQSWSTLPNQQFDAVIFQFPLVPGFSSHSDFNQQCRDVGVNTLNRRLLRGFLLNSFRHFLDPEGSQLAIITSKDVKPYREWDIENSLTVGTSINYLGSMPFNSDNFPSYQIRNVDRDKFVRDTQGISYVWSKQQHNNLKGQLSPAQYRGELYCAMCRVGPFGTEQDKQIHQQSKRHTRMAAFEQQWLADLTN